MKPGSVVQLLSGGPDMTIASVEDETARCRWFVGGQLKEKSFGLAELRDKPIDLLGMTDAELESEVRGGTLRWLRDATFEQFDPDVEKALEDCLKRLREAR